MGLLNGLFGPPSKEKFAQIAAEALRKAGETSDIRFDAEAFALVVGDSTNLLFLGNFYDLYCNVARGERPLVLEKMLATMNQPEAPSSFEEAKPLLIPTLRSLAYYDFSMLQMAMQGVNDMQLRPARTIGAHIGLSLVLDYPHTSSYLPPSQLEEWNVDFDMALGVAIENLRARSQEPFHQMIEGTYGTPWGDTYDASRLLLTDKIKALEVKGDHVALAVHRNMLLITGSEDREGFAVFAAAANDVFGESHTISFYPLVLRKGEWRDFELQPWNPLANEFKRLSLSEASGLYDEQQQLLQTIFERRGEEVFVAKFFATQHEETKELSSFCSWANAGVQLLPQADRISFSYVEEGREGEHLGIAPWNRVADVVPHLMKKTEHYPARWRVEGFPTREEIAKILET